MDIQHLHSQVCRRLQAPPPPYDPRMRAMISHEQYPQWLYDHHLTCYFYLFTLVQALQPQKVLELGTQDGGSALFLLLALPDSSQLITVESSPPPRYYLALCQEDPRLKCITGNDLDLRIYGDRDLQGIDLLFVDTQHTYEQVSQEWAMYTPYLVPGAVVVLDDIHLNGGMEQFWAEIKEPKVETGRGVHWSGWGIVQYRPVQQS